MGQMNAWETGEQHVLVLILRADLAASHARLEGLRNMVDLLVQERESLRQENILLQEKAARADPEIQEKLTEMVAEKALLESQIEDLNGRNEALAGNLADSELERRNLMDRLAELESSQLAGEPAAGLMGTAPMAQ